VLADGGDDPVDVGRPLDGVQMPPVTAIEPRQAGHAVVTPHRFLERRHVIGLRPEVRHQGVTQGNELREIDAAILVSTIVADTHEEKAIFGGGFRNGLIVMARRLLAQGLLPKRDPHAE